MASPGQFWDHRVMEPYAQEYDASRRLVISSILSAIFGVVLTTWGIAAESPWTIALGVLLLVGGLFSSFSWRRRMRRS